MSDELRLAVLTVPECLHCGCTPAAPCARHERLFAEGVMWTDSWRTCCQAIECKVAAAREQQQRRRRVREMVQPIAERVFAQRRQEKAARARALKRMAKRRTAA